MFRTVLILAFGATLLASCSKETNVQLKTKMVVGEVTYNTAEIQLVGEVTNSYDLFEWGVIYGENPDEEYYWQGNAKANDGVYSVSTTVSLVDLVPNTLYYAIPYCKRNGQRHLSHELISFRTDTVQYPVGSNGPAGGIVYFRSDDGWGMELSTVEFGSNDWGCTDEVLGTSSDLGSGATNTALILSDCPMSGTAPALCNDHVEGGFSDWHLPAYEDLYYVWYNLVETGEWTPTFTDYLTSTDCTNPSYGYASYNAYDIVNGHGISAQQGLNYYFFPVRRFEY